MAALVPALGRRITSAEASAYCRFYRSPERSLREYRIVTDLPRGASGKVILSELITLGTVHHAAPEPFDIQFSALQIAQTMSLEDAQSSIKTAMV